MLRSAVVLPSALRLLEGDHNSTVSCLGAIQLLQSMIQDGIILVDGDRRMVDAMYSAVRGWPDEGIRKLGASLLKQLLTNGRFVEVATSTAAPASHHLPECALGFDLARTYAPEAIISRAACLHDIVLNSIATEIISVDRAAISRFVQQGAEGRQFRIDEGAWTTAEFEKRVLKPIFRYASTVKIFDRYVATSIRRKQARVEPRFEGPLRWVVQTLADTALRQDWTLEIYTAVPEKVAATPGYRDVILAATRALEDDLRAKHGPRITIIVMREGDEDDPHHRMPHGRYITTNSCGVLIDRGFDLFWSDEQMQKFGHDPERDPRRLHSTEISLSSRPWDIEAQVRGLPLL